MLAFLGASAYFIGRAVKQEMELARLQSGFVAAVSHEFRSPLAAMRQVSELLAAGRVPTDERRQQNYQSLAAESRRLQRLVENLLDFGKLEAGAKLFELEPVDPRVLVERVVDEFRSQMSRPDRGARIDVGGDSGSRRLLGDAEALSLALRNLVDNAVKYSPPSGTIRISWSAEGERIALRVSDEGPGVAPEEQARIFQKFVRGAAATSGNVKGVGLGLAMVQHIVSGHGGEVKVTTERGRGATFTMLLPAAAVQ
jgi:two-component system phosphate regulon sensor histidine kinase PhoR